MINVEYNIDRRVHPVVVASKIAKNPAQARLVERRMWNCPGKIEDYLMDGAIETLQTFLKKGHAVTLWTGEYFKRVGRSGIGSRLRKELPRNERQRFSVVTASASVDKMDLLPDILQQAYGSDITTVVLVDNTKKKLEQAAEIIKKEDLTTHCKYNLVEITQETPVPTICSFSLPPHISWMSVSTIRELLSWEKSVTEEKILVLVDWNHTTIDTDRWEENMTGSVLSVI